MSRAWFREGYTPDWRRSYRDLGVPEDLWDDVSTRWAAEMTRMRPRALPWARGGLRRLRREGVRLGLVTASTRGVVEPNLARLNLEGVFEAAVFADDVAQGKPHPEGLLRALDELGVPAADTVYVGDTVVDLEMAHGRGRRVRARRVDDERREPSAPPAGRGLAGRRGVGRRAPRRHPGRRRAPGPLTAGTASGLPVDDPIAVASYHPSVDDRFDRLLTPRLVVRRFSASDATAFARYRSDPEVARYQSWHAPFPLEQAQAFLAWLEDHHPDEPGEWFQLAIAPREDPSRLLGDCGFRPRRDEPGIVDVGFTLAAGAQGQGYATEGVAEVLRYLFEDRGKHKVCADCDTRNGPSWRLLERLGFAREGELRESFRVDGSWASEYLYGQLASAWRAARARQPGAGVAARPAATG